MPQTLEKNIALQNYLLAKLFMVLWYRALLSKNALLLLCIRMKGSNCENTKEWYKLFMFVSNKRKLCKFFIGKASLFGEKCPSCNLRGRWNFRMSYTLSLLARILVLCSDWVQLELYSNLVVILKLLQLNIYF